MFDKGNVGQRFCFLCTFNRILSLSPHTEDMGQINLHASFDISGFVRIGYTNSFGFPNRQNIILTLQCLEA